MDRLFINKNAEDLSTQTREDLLAKRAQVQKWRHNMEQSQKPKPDTSSRSSAYRRLAPLPRNQVGRSGEGTSRTELSLSTSQEDDEHRVGLHGTEETPTASLLSLLDQGDCDPFNTAAISITSWENHLIQHSAKYLTLLVWPGEAKTRYQRAPAIAWWDDTREAITNTAQLHSYLAVAGNSKRLVQPRCDFLKTEAMAHKAEGLSSLRNQMTSRATNMSDHTLATILHLFTAEWIAQDIPAASIHFGAAYQMIFSSGGLGTLTPRRKEFVIYGDVNLAARCWRRPLFPVQEWASAANATEAQQLLETYPVNLTDVDSSIHDQSLRQLFLELRTIVAISGLLDHPEERTDTLLSWLYLQSHAAKARLVTFWADTTESTGSAEPSKSSCLPVIHAGSAEMCVCIAMLCFHTITFEHQSAALVWSHHLRLSIALLYACLQRLPGPLAPRLALWIYGIGAAAEEILSAISGNEDGSWYRGGLKAALDESDISSWDEADNVMSTFVSSDVLRSELRKSTYSYEIND